MSRKCRDRRLGKTLRFSIPGQNRVRHLRRSLYPRFQLPWMDCYTTARVRLDKGSQFRAVSSKPDLLNAPLSLVITATHCQNEVIHPKSSKTVSTFGPGSSIDQIATISSLVERLHSASAGNAAVIGVDRDGRILLRAKTSVNFGGTSRKSKKEALTGSSTGSDGR